MAAVEADRIEQRGWSVVVPDGGTCPRIMVGGSVFMVVAEPLLATGEEGGTCTWPYGADEFLSALQEAKDRLAEGVAAG